MNNKIVERLKEELKELRSIYIDMKRCDTKEAVVEYWGTKVLRARADLEMVLANEN